MAVHITGEQLRQVIEVITGGTTSIITGEILEDEVGAEDAPIRQICNVGGVTNGATPSGNVQKLHQT